MLGTGAERKHGKHNNCHTTWMHDDVIKWKHYLRYWLFVRGIHRPPASIPSHICPIFVWYIYHLFFHLRLTFTLSVPKFIACQIISAFTVDGPSFHLIAISSSSQPHIVFISNFNLISFFHRSYCLTLQPSFRSFRFVTILQPTIFSGSCSYLAQFLASVETCTVLIMGLCTFYRILWLFEMVRIRTGRSLCWDSLPLHCPPKV